MNILLFKNAQILINFNITRTLLFACYLVWSQDFLRIVERLLSDAVLRRAIIESAHEVVHQKHDCASERAEYARLVAALFPVTSSNSVQEPASIAGNISLAARRLSVGDGIGLGVSG
jgi:hypothetical protein